MSDIEKQEHQSFKIFSGPLGEKNSLGPLAEEVASFVSREKVAAKSIGVEYLEAAKRLIITLGYREGKEFYPVKLTSVGIGKVEDLATRSDFSELERAISEASQKVERIICHELYITEDNEFLIVFMTHEP
jgi:hypothetical protein